MKLDQYAEMIFGLSNKGYSSIKIGEVLQASYKNLENDNPESLARLVRQFLEKRLGSASSNGRRPQAKVLVYDIETSRTWVRAPLFSLWNQNISHAHIEKPWIMLCFSAKWLWEDKIMSFKLSKKEVDDWNDESLAKSLWRLFDEADVIIAHNNKKFDQKVAQTRFFAHRLNLPSPFLDVDTLVHAKKKFKIPSNRLDYLGEFLGLGRKIETEKGLWDKVEEGDESAMDRMALYCDQDVKLLEDVYLEMRPYVQPHPNIGLFEAQTGEFVCPTCGSKELEEEGQYATTVNVYQNYRCKSCGSMARTRKGMAVKDRIGIMSSVPK